VRTVRRVIAAAEAARSRANRVSMRRRNANGHARKTRAAAPRPLGRWPATPKRRKRRDRRQPSHADGKSVTLQERALCQRQQPSANRLGQNRRNAIIFRDDDQKRLPRDRPSKEIVIGPPRLQRQDGLLGERRRRRFTMPCGQQMQEIRHVRRRLIFSLRPIRHPPRPEPRRRIESRQLRVRQQASQRPSGAHLEPDAMLDTPEIPGSASALR